jgi:hypothetical protein
VLGFRGREELIHRDDLVILQHDQAGARPGAALELAEEKP